MSDKDLLEFDKIIEDTLVAIYQNNLLSKSLYLKGGQAVRLGEGERNRLSVDIDFSTPKSIDDDHVAALEEVIISHFDSIGLHVFDYTLTRRPKLRKDGLPEWWQGFAIEFKLIDSKMKIQPLNEKRKNAIKALGAQGSPKIEIDISPCEYCESFDEIEIKGTKIKKYSRELIIMEKLRAICQQHEDYKYRSKKRRSRDYYDISMLLDKYKSIKETKKLMEGIRNHLANVFSAKDVPINILDKIFEDEFLIPQLQDWEAVKLRVTGEKDFDVHKERVLGLVKRIKI